MQIQCPDYILKAIDILKYNGHSAYAVGGCVRDSVMGRTPNDWDMTTSATPDEMKRAFDGYRIIPTGIKHGTLTVMIDSHPVEITTMRIDGSYSDSRHPESVSFTQKIEEDLSRRDFTVNAMAYSPETGLVDPFGGRLDTERKIIRCVGNPDKRFHEDALRILRAIRFASVLGFGIEEETAASIIKNRCLLNDISKERIRAELIKLLCGQNVDKVLLEFKQVIFEIIPELQATDGFLQHTPYHIYDVWTHIAKVTSSIESTSDLRVAALLHDVEKPSMFRLDTSGIGHFKGHPQKGAQTAEEILRRLRFSNAEIKHIATIIYLHDERPDGNRHHLTKLCAKFGIDNVDDTMKLIIADAHGKNPSIIEQEIQVAENARKQISEMRAENACLSIHALDINGNDIMALGIDRTQIKDTLDYLLDSVIDEKTENKKAALEQAAENYANKK